MKLGLRVGFALAVFAAAVVVYGQVAPRQVLLGGTGIVSAGDAGLVLTSTGTGQFYMGAGGSGGGGAGTPLNQVGGRLSLTSMTPIPAGNVTGAGTLYFTPYQSDGIALWTGSAWTGFETAEISAAVGGLAVATAYDVFAFTGGDAGAGVALEFSAAWASTTARTDALAQLNGVWVKSADHTRRWLGTIETTSVTTDAGVITTAEDSSSNRFVYNFYNQTGRNLAKVETTQTWSYTVAAWRQANANTANTFSYISGMAYTQVKASVYALQTGSNGGNQSVGIGIDSTTANSATIYGSGGLFQGGDVVPTACFYKGTPGLGLHALNWIEWGSSAGAFEAVAVSAGVVQGGMSGVVWM